ADFTTTATGVYRWRAFFAGDTKNDAKSTRSEERREGKEGKPGWPAISTVESGPVTVGGAIHDVATLTGAVGATGAVTFQVYAPGDTNCGTSLGTLAAASNSTDANGNGTYTSADFTTTATGVYRWRAFFAGDTKNDAKST